MKGLWISMIDCVWIKAKLIKARQMVAQKALS